MGYNSREWDGFHGLLLHPSKLAHDPSYYSLEMHIHGLCINETRSHIYLNKYE
jgi:hypothetical protein